MSEIDKEIAALEGELEDEAPVKSKRLTPAEWERLKLLWEMGNHTLSKLSEEFGIRADTIQRRLSADSVQKGARAHEIAQESEDAVKDELAAQATEDLRRVHATKNDHYKWAEALAKLVMGEIVEAKNAKTAIGMRDANITTLGKAAKTLEVLRKERYALLNLDKEDGDPDDIPELLVAEMTEEQIKDLQASMRGVSSSPVDDLDLSALDNSDIVEEGSDVD